MTAPLTACLDWVAYCDGELADDGAAAFRIHLRSCAACRDRVLEGMQYGAQLSSLSPKALELEQRIREWVTADDAWQACPPSDVARFERTWVEMQHAKSVLRASVGAPPAPSSDPDWQSSVLARLKHTKKET